jgi:hypothetical protein
MNYLIKKENLLIFAGLVFIALFVSMLSPLNPLSRSVPATDPSVFLTIAQGILHGKLPYVDFFDHKGPLLYLIDVLGLFVGGYIGVWLLELSLIVISVFFAYKTARFFGDKLVALMGTVFSFALMTWFYRDDHLMTVWYVGEYGLPEEYVLPFIFISLYIFTKYYFTKSELTKTQVIVLGICFASSLLLKANMFAVWGAFCAVIFFRRLFQKEYKTILRYIVFFFTGIIIPFIPVILYLKYTGSYDECIRQYLGFNVSYSSPGIFRYIRFLIWATNVSLLPVIIALIWLLKNPYKIRLDFYMAYALALFFSFCLIAIGKWTTLHRCIVFIPLFVPAMTFCFDWLFRLFSQKKYSCIKYGAPILIACILFNKLIFAFVVSLGAVYNDRKNDFIQMGQFINQHTNENDSITVLGNNCAVYLFTDRPSVSKYIYQVPIAYIDPKIADEYISDVTHRKPAMIIIPSYPDGQFSFTKDAFIPILEMIDEEYYECFKSERYVIFKRSE